MYNKQTKVLLKIILLLLPIPAKFLEITPYRVLKIKRDIHKMMPKVILNLNIGIK